ncbi:MAG TPA: LEA type 2 family protein [Kofleriaceae bacterium]
MLRLVVSLALALTCATGCHTGKSTELRVLGVQDAASSHVFVQVTNPARRPMKLTKLEYTFASSNGATVAEGEMRLYREIPAGAAAVVEVPLDAESDDTLMLRGTLTAELDQVVRSFKLNAQIQPH